MKLCFVKILVYQSGAKIGGLVNRSDGLDPGKAFSKGLRTSKKEAGNRFIFIYQIARERITVEVLTFRWCTELFCRR